MSFSWAVSRVLSRYDFEKVGDLTKSEFEKLMADILHESVQPMSEELQFKIRQKNLAVGKK